MQAHKMKVKLMAGEVVQVNDQEERGDSDHC